jgi:hypothetical protein
MHFLISILILMLYITDILIIRINLNEFAYYEKYGKFTLYDKLI